jgi:hypothetical protein
VLLLLGGLAGCGPAPPAADRAGPQAAPPATAQAHEGAALPAGWRWESYGGVQVGVPGDWGWGNGAQRLDQWCAHPPGKAEGPVVGRPAAVTLVACPRGDATAAAATLVEKTGPVVAFDRTPERSATVTHEGDRTTLRLAGVLVVVQAPAGLRRQIVDTVHPVRVDGYGCPASHPISATPSYRPAEPVDVATLRAVTEVSACRYQLGSIRPGADARLVSSARLVGPEAVRAVREIARAPVGGGPDDPGDCLPVPSYGEEAIVATVRSPAGGAEIVLRYSGCDRNGFDDGVRVRSLTAAAVAPFVAGANRPLVFHGSAAKRAILLPPTPPR